MARILIVDDSPTETYRFKEILERHGHKVLEASNGADGVLWLAQSCLGDLVLMDVVMPGINGFQATRQITKRCRNGSYSCCDCHNQRSGN